MGLVEAEQARPHAAVEHGTLEGVVADREVGHDVHPAEQGRLEDLEQLGAEGAGELAREAERLGYAIALAPEGYKSDAPSVLGYVAARTERIALASGVMQVMPFWVTLIGRRTDNLFHLRTNLRYGCVILRHYLDIERGNLFRALESNLKTRLELVDAAQACRIGPGLSRVGG